MKKTRQKGMKAWLVTWESAGKRATRDQKVAAIFNFRLSPDQVREYVEFIYLSGYTLSERAACARGRTKNPYPAEFGSLDGLTWTGQIYCGSNPRLFARLVDRLVIEVGEEGLEKATWTELPKPDVRALKDELDTPG